MGDNNMNYDKYLPLGTVVLLKNGKKKVMITGFCTIDGEKKDKIYDCCGCVYPEGTLSSKQTLLFDHNQIEKIFHVGYVNEEEKEFKEKLKLYVKEAELQFQQYRNRPQETVNK